MDALGTWIDGVAAQAVPVDDRGLQYGDGVFETMRLRRGRIRFLEAHLARLALGCERLAIAADPAAVRADLERAIERAADTALVKLIVTRGSGRRGYAPRETVPRRIVMRFADPAAPPPDVTLGWSPVRSARAPLLAGIKHLNRLENVLAAREIDPADFDALMLDESGTLVSGTSCNVFVATRGVIATPPVDQAGVAGILRGVVLRECGPLGIRCEVRALTVQALEAADEVFVTNARIGVVPVRRVGEHDVPMNTLARRLATHIEALDA